MRKLATFAATTGLTAAMALGQLHSVSAANRGELWFVVHDICLPAYRSIGVAFPCAEVNIATVSIEALPCSKRLRAPRNVLVVPTNRISGIYEEVFDSLAHVRQAVGRWRHDYNNIRPHSALGGITPATARRALELLDGSAPGALAKPRPTRYPATGLSF